MKTPIRFLAVIGLAALFVTGASASPMVQYTGDHATGVLNLQVGSTLYDVDFVQGTFNGVFGSELPTFWNDRPAAVLANDALLATLNAESGSPRLGDSLWHNLFIPFALQPDFGPGYFRSLNNANDPGYWMTYGDLLALDTELMSFVDYGGGFTVTRAFAVFSNERNVSVPDEGSVALMLLLSAGLVAHFKRGKLAL